MTARSATPHTQSPDVTAFTAWLTASCERQGVPVTIRDPGVITQVATLLGHHSPAAATCGTGWRSTSTHWPKERLHHDSVDDPHSLRAA